MTACRSCGAALAHTFADLGMSPISNAFLKAEDLNRMEPFYPLHAYVCAECFLVQLEEFESPQKIFGDHYAYFSSYSDSWLDHARRYTEQMTARFGLGAQSRVIEIASNDGYLLQYFRQKGVPVLGIEPARNVAEAAVAKGIPTLAKFFGVATAAELVATGARADLLLGNNVLAHVPDLNDFVAGMKLVLKPDGVLTMEFPHLQHLIEQNQFDTIYHEHFSYFSFLAAERVFARHGLQLFDVEELPTHGGSLRIYGRHAGQAGAPGERVRALAARERALKFEHLDTYRAYAGRVRETKRRLLEFLISARRAGKTVVGYGAPAKGHTLLNYCGIRGDFIDFTVDRSPHKQNTFLPGTHIPVYAPERIDEVRPDYVLILPWNLRDEIVKQMAHIRSWGGKFVVPIPET
ncbi:MAG TPA: class I SAM-dependent methyltransferase, partial [Burkholderiales bacterium]|nr:class I SAM-dependent methyltransferase [Burkholderiales bacterium]